MSWQMHYGTTYQIKYGYCPIYGGDSIDAFLDIMRLWDCLYCTKDGEDEVILELFRQDIVDIKKIILENGKKYQEKASRFEQLLDKLELSKDEFIKCLTILIEDSDQENEYVLVSWF